MSHVDHYDLERTRQDAERNARHYTDEAIKDSWWRVERELDRLRSEVRSLERVLHERTADGV